MRCEFTTDSVGGSLNEQHMGDMLPLYSLQDETLGSASAMLQLRSVVKPALPTSQAGPSNEEPEASSSQAGPSNEARQNAKPQTRGS